jgi:arylsulfatase
VSNRLRAATLAGCGLFLLLPPLPGSLAACGRPSPPRLLLVVSVDTLRADELGAYGSSRGLSPELDALARESLVFEAAYAPVPLTLPALAALFTGRYPESLGMRNNESAVPDSVATLATSLAAAGWRTGAVVGNFVLRQSAGLARGFELYRDDFPQREAVRRWPERVAGSTTEAALELLDGCLEVPGSRCFLWAHYQDPHGPYDPPGDRRERQLERERAGGVAFARELPRGADHSGFGAIPDYQFMHGRFDAAWYLAGYRGEIAYVDEEVGKLLAALRARSLAERALVVFAADHGESLGEEDVWFAHGSKLGDAQVRVPLLLRGPGIEPGRRADPVSLVDVYPTLLALLGAEAPNGLPGRDLLAPGAEQAASRAYLSTLAATSPPSWALVADGYKLIASERAGVLDARLHRLGDEQRDLAAAAPQIAAGLRRELLARRRALGAGVSETPQALSAEERETLGALGYLEPGEAE